MAWPDLGMFSAVPPQALWLRAPGGAAEEQMISADTLGIRWSGGCPAHPTWALACGAPESGLGSWSGGEGGWPASCHGN